MRRLTLAAATIGLLAAATMPAAADCLAAPDGPAPDGQHWFYRTDRDAARKCWYLRAPDAATTGSVAADASAPPSPEQPRPSLLSPADQERLFQDFEKWRAQQRPAR